MMRSLVIARDAYDRPLKRLAIAETKSLTYLANPALEDAVKSGESWPVVFLPNTSIHLMKLYFSKWKTACAKHVKSRRNYGRN
jgi:hypothetical protein